MMKICYNIRVSGHCEKAVAFLQHLAAGVRSGAILLLIGFHQFVFNGLRTVKNKEKR